MQVRAFERYIPFKYKKVDKENKSISVQPNQADRPGHLAVIKTNV